jgi:hypothetical protein
MMNDDDGEYVLYTDYKAFLDKYHAEQAIAANIKQYDLAQTVREGLLSKTLENNKQ